MSVSNPSHDPLASFKTLRDAVTELAFEGHVEAPTEALNRLSQGEWTAFGDWRRDTWAGAPFSAQGRGVIRREFWQGLKLAHERGLTTTHYGEPLPTFGSGDFFSTLGCFDRETAHWDWECGVALTALRNGLDGEEFFVATKILVRVGCETAPVSESQTVGSANKGGRPATHDWEALLLAMAGRCYVEGWEPASPAAVIKAMQEWTSEQGLPEPSPSVARPKAKAFFDAFTAWQNAANENLR